MKLFNTVLTLILLFKFLQSERNRSYEEYLSRKRTQQPLTEPLSPRPTKYATARLNTSNEPIRPLQGYSHTPIRPFIISTTPSSKYTPEQLQAFYKINPYTNKPTNPPKKR